MPTITKPSDSAISQPNEPLVWIVRVRWGQVQKNELKTLTLEAHNLAKRPIPAEIHLLPYLLKDLQPGEPPCTLGERTLDEFLRRCNEKCPDTDGRRARAISEYIQRQSDFDIRVYYRLDEYSIEVDACDSSGHSSETTTSNQKEEKSPSDLTEVNEEVSETKADSEADTDMEAYRNQLKQDIEMLKKNRESLKLKIKDEMDYLAALKSQSTQMQKAEITEQQSSPDRLETDRGYGDIIQQLQTGIQKLCRRWEEEKANLKNYALKIYKKHEEQKKQIETYRNEIVKLQKEITKLKEDRQRAEKAPPELEKISAALKEAEEKRKELIRDLDVVQRETDERLKLHQGIKGKYQELLLSFNMEDEISEESSGVEKTFQGFVNLKNRLERMSPAGFLLETEKIRNEFGKLSQEAKAEVPWDSVLMAFLRRMREEVEKGTRQPPLEEQIGRLQVFVGGRGFALIWPSVGDELVMREHQILREDVVEGIGRGRVVRALTPGLKRGEEVILKAGVVLAR